MPNFKDLDLVMNHAFAHCTDIPYNADYRDSEIRSRYVDYVARLECLVRHFCTTEEDVQKAIDSINRAYKTD